MNGKRMRNLHSQWKYEICTDLEKHHVFPSFESVIITITENKNKMQKKLK